MKQTSLRVATYNVAAGRFDRDFSGISADIRAANADIVGLQEIDQNVNRSGGEKQTEKLAQTCGYPYAYFTHAIDLGAGEYGTAILSRLPLSGFTVHPLPSPGVEKRSVGGGILHVGTRDVAFFNTHLSFENDEVRCLQLRELAALLTDYPTFVLTGDFNTDNYSAFSLLSNVRLVNSDENKKITFPPDLGIDNIVFSQDLRAENVTVGADGHSDHRLLAATVYLP